MTKNAEILADSIHTLLRVFTVNEMLFPPAGGETKYNGIDFRHSVFLKAIPDAAHET